MNEKVRIYAENLNVTKLVFGGKCLPVIFYISKKRNSDQHPISMTKRCIKVKKVQTEMAKKVFSH